MPLPAIRLGLDRAYVSGESLDFSVPQEIQTAVAEYIEALLGAGLNVVGGRHFVKAWQFIGHGPSIRILVDGTGDLESSDRRSVRGRLAPPTFRPSPKEAVLAAQQCVRVALLDVDGVTYELLAGPWNLCELRALLPTIARRLRLEQADQQTN